MSEAFAIHCLSAPSGFNSALELINQLAESKAFFEEIVLKVLAFVNNRSDQLVVSEYSRKISATGLVVPENQLRSAINALTHVLRGARECKVDSRVVVKTLSMTSELSATALECISAAIELFKTTAEKCTPPAPPAPSSEGREGESATEGGGEEEGGLASVYNTLSAGRLLKMEWKVGVAVASSHCKGLRTPYVTLLLHATDSEGRVQVTPVELSIEEFQNFSTTLQHVGGLMDSM